MVAMQKKKLFFRFAFALILTGQFVAFVPMMYCRADEQKNANSDPFASALEKRKAATEKLKAANEEFESLKAAVAKPAKSDSDCIEMQYRLKKAQREINQIRQELKDSESDINKAIEFNNLWKLWQAALKNSSELMELMSADKFTNGNKEELLQLIFQKAVPRNSYDFGSNINPQVVGNKAVKDIETEHSTALLKTMEGTDARKKILSLLRQSITNLVTAYFEYQNAVSDEERQRSFQKMVDLAGDEVVDEVINNQ